MLLERIVLAAPRGFCAGVAYAIEVVDLALRIHGSPLYVKHAIVHNEHVVKSFEERGVVFVEDITVIPEGSPVVFSAHGVSPQVREQSAERNLEIIDATCPLVTKVHNEAKRFANKGFKLVYVGHRGHVEAEGTTGEAKDSWVGFVETVEEAEQLEIPFTEDLAVLTQTTLSVEEVEQILAVLKRRFPHIKTSGKEDICYATTNRQAAVRELAKQCSMVLVVGSTTSSNSNRLREVAETMGSESVLLMTPDEVDLARVLKHQSVGITSGASTPEVLVEDIIGYLLQSAGSGVKVEVLETVQENVEFRPHRELIRKAEISSASF
ncbi:MAG: 4-hydroxy-3-methylbut-2-enyl diphosphate reductase [Fimbriimonadaceae bacterium]